MSRRTERVAEAIREVASMTILTELRDPRIKGVTVLGAEVPGDLRSAKVLVSVMGGAKKENLAMQGLNSAAGLIQKRVGERLDLRYVPILSFKLDRGLKNAAETSRLLAELEAREGPLSDVDGKSDDDYYDAEYENVPYEDDPPADGSAADDSVGVASEQATADAVGENAMTEPAAADDAAADDHPPSA